MNYLTKNLFYTGITRAAKPVVEAPSFTEKEKEELIVNLKKWLDGRVIDSVDRDAKEWLANAGYAGHDILDMPFECYELIADRFKECWPIDFEEEYDEDDLMDPRDLLDSKEKEAI